MIVAWIGPVAALAGGDVRCSLPADALSAGQPPPFVWILGEGFDVQQQPAAADVVLPGDLAPAMTVLHERGASAVRIDGGACAWAPVEPFVVVGLAVSVPDGRSIDANVVTGCGVRHSRYGGALPQVMFPAGAADGCRVTWKARSGDAVYAATTTLSLAAGRPTADRAQIVLPTWTTTATPTGAPDADLTDAARLAHGRLRDRLGNAARMED